MRMCNVDVISVILRWPQLACTFFCLNSGDDNDYYSDHDFEVADDLDVNVDVNDHNRISFGLCM